MGLPTEDNIYGYNASKPAAIIFTALNFLLLGYHGYLSLWLPSRFSRTRTHTPIRYKHRYTICLFVASMLSTAGYSIRVASIGQPDDVTLYAIQSSYVVISPIFVCASLYWLLKHLVLLLLPSQNNRQRLLGVVSPRWLGRIFIASDVTSFLTQGAGSGIASSGNWEGTTLDVGMNVLLTGLALQLATFTAYLVVVGWMVYKARRCGGLMKMTMTTPTTMGGAGGKAEAGTVGAPANVSVNARQGAKRVLIGVWIAAAFVQTRTIFRLVEFTLGIEGYPFQHEWMLYVFDSVPMVIALAVLGWWHPIKHLQTKRLYEEVDAAETESESKEGPLHHQSQARERGPARV